MSKKKLRNTRIQLLNEDSRDVLEDVNVLTSAECVEFEDGENAEAKNKTIQSKLSLHEGKISKAEGRIGINEGKIGKLEGRASSLETRTTNVENKANTNERDIKTKYDKAGGVIKGVVTVLSGDATPIKIMRNGSANLNIAFENKTESNTGTRYLGTYKGTELKFGQNPDLSSGWKVYHEGNKPSWGEVTGKPETFPATTHEHPQYETTVASTSKHAATLKSAQQYAEKKVSDLVGTAPDTLNTLEELADALGRNDNFATTMTEQLAGKAPKVHDHNTLYFTQSQINGFLNGKANTSHGTHVPKPEPLNNAKFLRNDNTWQTVTPANIGAADRGHSHGYLPLTGGTMTGDIKFSGGGWTGPVLSFKPGADANGAFIGLGAGGTTVVGSGESMPTVKDNTPNGGSEEMIVASDSLIKFYTNMQSGWSTKKEVSIDGSGIVRSSAGFNGPLAGNASSASKLSTSRQINGTDFDGTKPITTAKWGTPRNIQIGNTTRTVDGGGNVVWSLGDIGAAANGHKHSSADITSLSGYKKAASATAIASGDSLNVALGKLEKALEGKANTGGSYAPANHNHTSLTGVTSIDFKSEGSDSSAIKTNISGNMTCFDFYLSDDLNNDKWRWRFRPSGGSEYSAMELQPKTSSTSDLVVSGEVYARGNKVYHAGNKPRPQDIDAADRNHTHDGRYVVQNNANGHWGLTANGDTTNWVRTTKNGLLPYASGGGSSSLGTPDWSFNAIHGKTIYENNTSLANKYAAKSHNHNGYHPRKYATDFGSTSTATYTITHSLGSEDVAVTIREKASKQIVYADVVCKDANTITITLGANAPGSNYFRVVVIG